MNAYKVSSSNYILFDSKILNVRHIQLKPKHTMPELITDDVIISVTDISDNKSDTNHSYLYMKLSHIPPQNSPPPKLHPIFQYQLQRHLLTCWSPAFKTLSFDYLKQSIGFLKTKLILRHFRNLSNGSVTSLHIDSNSSLNPGENASIKSPCMKKILPSPTNNVIILYIVILDLTQPHCTVG